jgi:hypothetical protein
MKKNCTKKSLPMKGKKEMPMKKAAPKKKGK